ncbi:MAG: diguanylate cyclase [Pseudomarimonas sp.]
MRTATRITLALCCIASFAAAASDTLEQRVAEIELLNTTAPWQQSAELLDALAREASPLPTELAYRADLVRMRNLALAGQFQQALTLSDSLLSRKVSPDLRVRALALTVNVSTGVADYPTAFARLKEGLALLDTLDSQQPRLLGMASYLYLRVGEEKLALEFAEQSLAIARNTGNGRDVCIALSNFGVALDEIGHSAQAEAIRREQIDACGRVGDLVFVADGHKGVGRSLLAQALPKQAQTWLLSARERFAAAGFANGVLETDMRLAEALLRSGGSLSEATTMLRGALPTFETQKAWDNIEQAHDLLSEIAEAQGQPAEALAELRLAEAAREELAKDARKRRLSYLQVEFDTEAKQRQISTLQAEQERQRIEIEARSRTSWLQGLGLLSLLLVAALLVSLLTRTVSERRRYREASERDGLTGLFNHQSTLRFGRDMQQRCRRERKPFTAVVADIDRFKQINDRHGHAAGDAVLRELGRLMHAVFPGQAVIGRSGGEEFTMLLDASIEQTRFLIEDLRRRIQPVEILDEVVEYSLSYGICAATDSHAPLEDILRSADLALYQAKRSGRNRVVDATSLVVASAPESGLVVVGSGIQLGRHMSPRCLSEIQEAERVFALTDGAAHAMIAELRPDLIDLRVYYAVGKDRRQTYQEMDAAIMAEVRTGRRVCAVFYGHPGVFADVPHAVIRKAREAGFSARMEPGISSEACLYADLGIDPGKYGVQSLEATQFLHEDRHVDNRGLLLLWQVALTGDLTCTRFHAVAEELAKLVQRLLLDYPADHEVILYEAARLPIESFRAEHLPLSQLASAHYEEYTTLVVPPCAPRHPDVTARLLQTMRRVGRA